MQAQEIGETPTNVVVGFAKCWEVRFGRDLNPEKGGKRGIHGTRGVLLHRYRGYGYTVGQINQKYRLKYWANRSSVRSHRSLVRLLRTARFARALRSWDSELLDGYLICVFFISGP